jgi:DNA-binding NarL/FixJ family response regulator
MSEAMKLRVVIADDHRLMRDGLKALFATEPDISVVAEASDGRDALRLIAEAQPDVVLMDISMPGLNGIEALRMVRERHPATRVVVLSMHSDAEHVARALNAGANGYVLKDAAGSDLVTAIRAIRGGHSYVSAGLQHLTSQPRPKSGTPEGPLGTLSRRERQVLQLVAEGRSTADIAALVHLSPKTVETYRSRLMKKLDLHDRTALVKFALKHGVTSLD